MEDGRIADYQLSASTILSSSYHYTSARLDRAPPSGVSAWCARYNRKGEYVEVDLLRNTNIKGEEIYRMLSEFTIISSINDGLLWEKNEHAQTIRLI